MNIRKFLKWSLVLMAILAYKQLEGSNNLPEQNQPVYMTSSQSAR